MAKKQTNRVKPLSLALQDLHIRSQFRGFASSRGRDRAERVWVGTLQPTLESPRYRVKVQYHVGETPLVWVLSPTIKPGAPHTYSKGNLCLYTPWEQPWRGDALLAETVIPWAAI